jgi:hypothetical protein
MSYITVRVERCIKVVALRLRCVALRYVAFVCMTHRKKPQIRMDSCRIIYGLLRKLKEKDSINCFSLSARIQRNN